MPVRTGHVNGLPCVSIYKTVEDRHHAGDERPPLGPQGGWTAGLPDWWPQRPTEQCLDCGHEYRDGEVGHFCTGEGTPGVCFSVISSRPLIREEEGGLLRRRVFADPFEEER